MVLFFVCCSSPELPIGLLLFCTRDRMLRAHVVAVATLMLVSLLVGYVGFEALVSHEARLVALWHEAMAPEGEEPLVLDAAASAAADVERRQRPQQRDALSQKRSVEQTGKSTTKKIVFGRGAAEIWRRSARHVSRQLWRRRLQRGAKQLCRYALMSSQCRAVFFFC